MGREEERVTKRPSKKPKSADRVHIEQGLWSYGSIERNLERETEAVLKIVQEAEKTTPKLPIRIPS